MIDTMVANPATTDTKDFLHVVVTPIQTLGCAEAARRPCGRRAGPAAAASPRSHIPIKSGPDGCQGSLPSRIAVPASRSR
jgi:hypothetical protein